MISRNGRYSLVVVELEEGGFAELQDAYADTRQEVRPGPLEVVATGEIPLNEDFESVTETDLKRAEVVSRPLALLMLLFVFGSVIAAGLPIGVGVLAVTGGFVGTLLLARAMDVSIYATNIVTMIGFGVVVTMIGFGVAIDYSLFVVSRFREEVGRRPVPEALARTMATAGRAILFSGLTVAIDFIGFLFFDVADLNSIGFAGSIVVAFSVLYGLTFLPALLAILGPRVDFLHLPFARPERLATGSGLWHGVARSVMAHPWRTLSVGQKMCRSAYALCALHSVGYTPSFKELGFGVYHQPLLRVEPPVRARVYAASAKSGGCGIDESRPSEGGHTW